MKKTILLVLISLTLFNCKKETPMSEKEDFGWGAGVTSADGYTIEVHTGYLATKKDITKCKFINSNYSIAFNCWVV